MLAKLARDWQRLKKEPPGKRFESHYRRKRDAGRSKWSRALSFGGAVVALAIGVVLVFIPGPAIVFFALGAGLLASQSLWVARALDWMELELRVIAATLGTWWRSRSWFERLPVVLAAIVAVLGVGLAAFEAFTGRLSR